MSFLETIFATVIGSIISTLIIYSSKTFWPRLQQLWRHLFMELVVIKDFDDGPPCFGTTYRYKKWCIYTVRILFCFIIPVIVLLCLICLIL